MAATLPNPFSPAQLTALLRRLTGETGNLTITGNPDVGPCQVSSTTWPDATIAMGYAALPYTPREPGAPAPNPLVAYVQAGAPIVQAVEHGVKFDGSTDDYTAWSSLLASATAGTVIVGKGGVKGAPMSRVSKPLKVPDGVALLFSAWTVLPADFANFGNAYVLTPVAAADRAVIQDCYLDLQARNGAKPTNQCGGIAPGDHWHCERVFVDDPNYYGWFINNTTGVRLIDCESDRGAGLADTIGGGGNTNLRVVRHVYHPTLGASNRFDNVGGTDVKLIDCRDDATGTGGVFFEGMTDSAVEGGYWQGTSGITIKSDQGYSPTTAHGPLRNRLLKACVSGPVEISYDWPAQASYNLGGYNEVSGNILKNQPNVGVLVNGGSNGAGNPGRGATMYDRIAENWIIDCNASNVATVNTGINTVPTAGVALASAYPTIVERNTVVDDRVTHLMVDAFASKGTNGGWLRDNIATGWTGSFETHDVAWSRVSGNDGASGAAAATDSTAMAILPANGTVGTNPILTSGTLAVGRYLVTAVATVQNAAFGSYDIDLEVSANSATISAPLANSNQLSGTATAVTLTLSGIIDVTAAGTINLGVYSSAASTATVLAKSLNQAQDATYLSWVRLW